jgi:hypothetical protein
MKPQKERPVRTITARVLKTGDPVDAYECLDLFIYT